MKKVILLIVGVIFSAALFAGEKEAIRLGGEGYGNYTFKDSSGTFSNGAFDQKLSGSSLGASYIITTPGNLFGGERYETLNLKGPTDGKTSGTAKDKIDEFNTSFILGLIGYEKETENFYIQPNFRIGSSSTSAKFTDSSGDGVPKSQSTSGSAKGFGIDLPITYKKSDTVGLGENLTSFGIQYEIVKF